MTTAPPPIKGFKVNGSLTAVDASGALAVVIACGSSRGLGVSITGTFVGTFQVEQTLDAGTTWVAKTVIPYNGGAGVTSATAAGQWKAALGGETHVRVRCSAFTSGTAVVDLNTTAGDDRAIGPGGGATDTLIGAVTETAPATDTASSGLNGRLQRIAQRLTTLIADIGDVADAAWTVGSGSTIALLKAIAGAAISTAAVLIYRADSYSPISTKTTTVVKASAGTLGKVIINAAGTADTITIYDALTATGTPVATIGAALIGTTFAFDCAMATGITVVTGGTTAGNYTITFR